MKCMDFAIPYNEGSILNACGKCRQCKLFKFPKGTLLVKFDEVGEQIVECRTATKEEIDGANKSLESQTDEMMKNLKK